MEVFYSQLLLKVLNSWSPNAVFPPWKCSARPLLQPPPVTACLGVSLRSVLSSVIQKHALSGDKMTDLANEEYPVFASRNSRVAFAVRFGSLSICTVKLSLISFVAFLWIWAESIALYTLQFVLLLLSAEPSSINTGGPLPLAAVHARACRLCNLWLQAFVILYIFSWRRGLVCKYLHLWQLHAQGFSSENSGMLFTIQTRSINAFLLHESHSCMEKEVQRCSVTSCWPDKSLNISVSHFLHVRF